MLGALNPHEVTALYREVAEALDVPVKPVRDELVLELVCARPVLARARGLDVTAMLVEGLLANMPFAQLNMATSLVVMHASLAQQGLTMACSPTALERALNEWVGQRTMHPKIHDWLKLATEPI